MTDLLFPDWQNKGGRRPVYTKQTIGEPVIPITDADMKTMEEWAVEILYQALIPTHTDPKDPAA